MSKDTGMEEDNITGLEHKFYAKLGKNQVAPAFVCLPATLIKHSNNGVNAVVVSVVKVDLFRQPTGHSHYRAKTPKTQSIMDILVRLVIASDGKALIIELHGGKLEVENWLSSHVLGCGRVKEMGQVAGMVVGEPVDSAGKGESFKVAGIT